MPDPITPEQRFAEIRDLRVDSCSADAPYNPDVWALEYARMDLLAEVDRLKAQIITYDRLNRVAIDDWEREVDRLKEVAYNQAHMISEITSACMAAELERDTRLTATDVERFLKRERDEYEPGGECWNTVDDVLDWFRLHMVTGTPLTEPRPEEGPSDPSVGRPQLTEAEELRAEAGRLNAELKANRQRWYHNDQSRTECVAGFDPETRECAEGGGKVFSEVEYQAQLIEIWTDLTRSYERDVARLTSERDRLKARVEELSALLIDPDRPTERARELRAIHARDEMDREMDRLADGGDL